MGEKTLEDIKKILDSKKILYEHIKHSHVHRSEEAAKIRGNTVEQAAKAIVLKVKKRNSEYELIQCVLSGHRKIYLKKLKQLLDLKSAGLATPEEVLEKTGCTIGSVPPFGGIFGMLVYMDPCVLEQETIFFSAGTHNDSVKMKSKDYVEATSPNILGFCE